VGGSLPTSSPGQDRRPGWLLPSQFCAAGEARRERLALLPALLREQGTGLHEPQGEPGGSLGPNLGPAESTRKGCQGGGKCPGEGSCRLAQEGKQIRRRAIGTSQHPYREFGMMADRDRGLNDIGGIWSRAGALG
jgi:hypothetical protein